MALDQPPQAAQRFRDRLWDIEGVFARAYIADDRSSAHHLIAVIRESFRSVDYFVLPRFTGNKGGIIHVHLGPGPGSNQDTPTIFLPIP